MLRKILWTVAGFITVGAVGIIGLGVGFYSHREAIEPIAQLGERVITKGRRVLNMRTETHGMVDRLETTYLTLRGKAYLMPDNDFLTGGALTVWDEDLLVINRRGEILMLDEDSGLSVMPVGVPDNGLEGYIKLAAEKYPDQIAKDGAVRYNDLEYIDSADFRGLLVSYTFIDVANECYRNRVSKLDLPEDIASIRDLEAGPDDWEVLYDTNPCLEFNEERELIVAYMSGGRIAFKEPNLVYLGSGEYHREGFYRPDAGIQDDDSDYGKTIEINLTSGEGRIFSKGHRNLQGVVIDTEGRLWTTEHGMRGGDELNLIKDSENYGWPLENLGTLYNGQPAPSEGGVGRHEVYKAPVYAWLPSAAVSSLAVVDDFHEAWDGDLLIGSLKGRTLFRARIRDERLVFLEPIPIGQRVRDVMQLNSTKIALWLDTNEVAILELEERIDRLEGMADGLIAGGMSAELATNAAEIIGSCNECHSYEDLVHGAGPSLHGIIGRNVASTAFGGYSEALRNLPGVWDRETLSAYLQDPAAVAPGTAMSGFGLGNKDISDAVITGFEWMDANNKK